MVNLRVCALECEALRGLLTERAAQCLVLDCRSFFSFNAAHIRGSCNVRLSTIVRRRAKGALALEHVVPNEELRARLRQGLVHTVVLLDERSADLELPKRDSTLLLALGTLCREARGARICFLKGGYEAFSSACSELCTKPAAPTGLSLPLSASSAPGSADSGCSSCGTPLYDQGGPVEILPFLYLGSAYHASRKDMLDALGITALINVSANCPNHFEGHYQYKSIPVEDNHKADISSWFNEAIDFIGKRALFTVCAFPGVMLTSFPPVKPTFEAGEFHSLGESYLGNTSMNFILLGGISLALQSCSKS